MSRDILDGSIPIRFEDDGKVLDGWTKEEQDLLLFGGDMAEYDALLARKGMQSRAESERMFRKAFPVGKQDA